MAQFEIEKFIEIIKNKPILWDLNHLNYKKIKRKAATWRNLSEECGVGVEFAKKKWKRLRDSYLRENNNRRKTSDQGALESGTGWKYYDQLEFLADNIKPRSIIFKDEDINVAKDENSSQDAGKSTSTALDFASVAEAVSNPKACITRDLNDSGSITQKSPHTETRSSAKKKKLDKGVEKVTDASTRRDSLRYRKHLSKQKTNTGHATTKIDIPRVLSQLDEETSNDIDNAKRASERDTLQQDNDNIREIEPYDEPAPRETPLVRRRKIIPKTTTTTKQQEEPSSILMQSILNKKEQEDATHTIDKFFSLMAATVKTFYPIDQHLVKTKVFTLVSEIEEKYLVPASS